MSGTSSKTDPELRMHKEWLGLLQPVGLVVSPLALVRKQAVLDRDGAVRLQALLRPLVDASDPLRPALLRDLPALFEQVLGWADHEYLGGEGRPLPDSLEVRLPELDELLRPTYAVPDVQAPEAAPDAPPRWLLLVEELPARTPLDDTPKDAGRGWHATPQAKFERMLRELGCPIGLLCNGELVRLVYAPSGETSGHLSFPIGAMTEVANRPMLAALHLLLSADRLLGQSDDRRLPALLHESRKYQNEVSTELAEQVLGALIELLRGFQAADEAAGGALLGECTGRDPKHVYGGLLTVLLRLVFVLYAEDRGLLPDDPTWARNYAVVGLFERLREDDGLHHDTMDQRYGAWAWLLTLFRLVFLGGGHGPALHLPARKGQLFDPNAYPFLEGRMRTSAFEPGERLDPPRVSDGTIFRVLQGLLVLDGERLSYRSLDVEQIGSVYESMMGYEVERAKGPSIGVGKQHVVIDLATLLAEKAKDRAKWLEEHADVKLGEAALKQLQAATTPEQAAAALQRRLSKRTPTILPTGALYLQPGEERRRTGSHYTPRSLTEPIVRTTLRPLLDDLGPTPTEAQVLALKVCDPAMGSGAFLVEACRQLADVLLRAWSVHGTTRRIPVDEEPRLHARRLVAEHCLYGVDKNPFAVNLAKLSLWLATLAKDHTFTFLDHALKCGDSLVGLTRRQIAEFRWDDETADEGPLFARVREQIVAAVAARLRIREEGEDADDAKRMWNAEAERALEDARLQGDAVIAAFFAEDKPKEREKRRVQLWDLAQRWHGGDAKARAELAAAVGELREKGVVPFHWEIEFPEVFGEGFSAGVGNPPFMGSVVLGEISVSGYTDFLRGSFSGATGKVDLIAYFIQRIYGLALNRGAIGLVSTTTARYGDTRDAGLLQIVRRGGNVYNCMTRIPWVGDAAVIVSRIHVRKNAPTPYAELNGKIVSKISAFLLPFGPDESPSILSQTIGAYLGSKPGRKEFIFSDKGGNYSSLDELAQLQSADTRPSVIQRFVGGDDLTSLPALLPMRWIADLSDYDDEGALQRDFPMLYNHLRRKIGVPANKGRWWQFARKAVELRDSLRELAVHEPLALAETAKHFSPVKLPPGVVPSNKCVVFTSGSTQLFCILASRTHEAWSYMFGTAREDRLCYVPKSCFQTFPFPKDWESNQSLETAGQTYYDYRAALMLRNDEGLTKTYNRFHDPDETSAEILELRALHAAMDRAVLSAYGWHDLAERATCEFQLEYEEPEDEDDEGRTRKKKKPWRYKWPQDFHDEVLARLLELNQQYAEEERLAGEAAAPAPKQAGKKKSTAKKGAAKKGAAKKTTAKKASKQTPKQVSLLDDED